MRGNLLAGGIALILVGWLGSGITDSIASTTRSPPAFYTIEPDVPSLPNWAFGWIPVLHALAAIDGFGEWRALALFVGGISASMEIIGLIMAVRGQMGSPRAPTTGSFSFRLGAPNTDGGVSGVLTF